MQQNRQQDALRKNFEDKLPKNIRQIGEVSQSIKIYIEDYTFNYLRRMQKAAELAQEGKEANVKENGKNTGTKERTNERSGKKAAILVGEKHLTAKTTYFFVSGIVELKADIQKNAGRMAESQKKQLQHTVETYYGKDSSAISQLGWCYMSINTDKIPEECENFHKENFGAANTLFLAFYEGGEEKFYINENGKLKEQSGYYVYFQRTPGMQQYAQDFQATECVEAEPLAKGNSESYRMLLAKRKEEVQKKHLITFLYTASTFLVMVVIVLGITLINHYDKLREMQNVITSLSKSVVNGQPSQESEYDASGAALQDSGQTEKEITKEAISSAETALPQETKEATAQESSKAAVETDAKNTTEENSLAEEGDLFEAAQTSKEGLRSYVIQEGDTLIGISRKIYNNAAMVKEICECNGIENSDEIKAGDKIWLP